FAPSPLLTTLTMMPPDPFFENISPGGICPDQIGSPPAFWCAGESRKLYSRAAQLETLNFSRHRFRQFAAKSHFARHFVRDEPRFDVLADFRRQFLRALHAPEHPHNRPRTRQP